MGRRSTNTETKVSLPITPMLDMTFQLLFFFVINFNPADLEGQLDMSLPSENVTQNKDKNQKPDPKVAPAKNEEEFTADMTILVRTQQGANADGSISAISVRKLQGKDEPVNGMDGLKAYLIKERATLTNKEGIKILGDGKLRIKYLMKVLDVCKEAGFPNTSFVKPD